MKFLIALLTLAASTSAVDLALHANNDCGGTTHACTNMNPNTCCGLDLGDRTWRSVSVKAIPTDWNVQCRGYTNGRCNSLQDIRGNNGGVWICNRSENRFSYTGVGYNFAGKKRDVTAVKEPECTRPDKMTLADGAVYDLTDLDDEKYYEL